jgi:hypothetical protein
MIAGLKSETRKARAEVDALPRSDRIAERIRLAESIYADHPAALLRFMIDPRDEDAWNEVQYDHLLCGGRMVHAHDEDMPRVLSWDHFRRIVTCRQWDFRPCPLLAGNHHGSFRGSVITRFLKTMGSDRSGAEFGPLIMLDRCWPRSWDEAAEAARLEGDGLYILEANSDGAMQLVRIHAGQAWARGFAEEWEALDE